MTATTVRRPTVAALPVRPRRRPVTVCEACGPSFEWQRPTAATLELVLAMHHVNGTCDPTGLRGVVARMRARLGV